MNSQKKNSDSSVPERSFGMATKPFKGGMPWKDYLIQRRLPDFLRPGSMGRYDLI